MASAEVMKIGPGAGMDASGVGVPAIGWQSEVVLVLHVGLCLAAQCVCQTPALLCCILGFALYTALALFTLLIALLELFAFS